MEEVVNYVVANFKSDIKTVFSGSVPYLKLAGVVLGAWQLGRAALIAHRQNAAGQGDTILIAENRHCSLLRGSHPHHCVWFAQLYR